jgi:hypothetical protein
MRGTRTTRRRRRRALDRSIAFSHAAARVAIGTGIALAPGRSIGRQWFGHHAEDGATRIAMRGMGVRESILGLALLGELRRGGSASDLFALCVAAELVDVTGSLLGPQSFRRPPATNVTALALTAIASGTYLARRRDG